MKEVISRMNGGQILMLLASITAAISLIFTLSFVENTLHQIIITSVISIALVLSSRVAMPLEYHRMKTVRFAIWIFATILIVATGVNNYTEIAAIFIATKILGISSPYIDQSGIEYSSIAIVIAATAMLIFVIIIIGRESPLGDLSSVKGRSSSNYAYRRAAFCAVLKSNIEHIDEELRWDHREFVDLRAEVDVRNSDETQRRVTDLVAAIKSNKLADIFVVLGVPGAGKSVALRKSCIDLLSKQGPNERIPVYVNLKEWTTSRQWTAEAPPTDQEFAEFVKFNIKDRLPDRTRAFFEENFGEMVDRGEIFFVFDSFDEIPGVLDADESSKLINDVSAVIIRYFRGQTAGRGVIASRYYRRPQLGQERHVQLDVRPFSESQIAKAIDQGASRPQRLKEILFVKRPEFGVLARNPFTLSLILLHWEKYTDAPSTQSELFATYISKSLEDAGNRIRELGLESSDLLIAMADISWAMFQSDKHGLEMTVGEMRAALNRDDMDAIVETLIGARLARKAPRTQAVSFVHRRFNEYFLIARWLSGERDPPFEAVPTDSRYRDALTLYAEVANDVEAKRLAEFCWNEVSRLKASSEIGPTELLRAIHSLRFLTEAFRSRLGAVAAFADKLASQINTIFTESDDILTRKIAVEAVGLLRSTDAEVVLMKALSGGNRWIIETAFSACRYLPKVAQSVEDALFKSIAERDQSWISLPDREFSFTLKVADSFRSLRRRVIAYRIEMWATILAGMASVVLMELSARWWGITTFAIVCTVSISIFHTFSLFEFGHRGAVARGGRGIAPRKRNMHVILRPGTIRIEPVLRSILSNGFETYEWLIGSMRAVSIVILSIYISTRIITNVQMDWAGEIVPAIGENLDRARRFQEKVSEVGGSHAGAIAAALAVFYVPIISIGVSIKDGRTGIAQVWRAGRRLVSTILGIAIAIIVVTLILLYIPRVVFLTTAFAGLPIAIYIFIRDFWSAGVVWYRDRTRLAKTLVTFNPSRALISESFRSFETDKAREAYVRWIERQARAPEYRQALLDLIANPWPQGRRPNINDSEASTLLAQLDAKWIGLDA